MVQITRSSVNGRPIRITFGSDQKVIRSSADRALKFHLYVVRITIDPFSLRIKVIRRTLSVLLRIARSSVDGRPIRTTCDTDQQVIRISVNGTFEAGGVPLLKGNLLKYVELNENECSEFNEK